MNEYSHGAGDELLKKVKDSNPTKEKEASSVGYLTVPRELTAENGVKGLLIGEFFEVIEIRNEGYCGCGECDACQQGLGMVESYNRKVYVSWTTIKDIYKMAVERLGR